MRKILLIVSCFALAIVSANAREVSRQQAAKIAAQFGRSITAAENTRETAQPELVYTEQENGTPLFYVFNRPGKGYIIVAADDNATSVLAYSDTQRFTSIDQIPTNMRAWLCGYAREIKAVAGRGGIQAPRKVVRQAVTPLITTKWNQTEPYNASCPFVEGMPDPYDEPGSQPKQVHAASGCVATTMAQLLYYHRNGVVPTGKHSYEWAMGGGNVLSVDLTNRTYDWDNMLDDYSSGEATDEQINAVAKLIADCAIVMDMEFTAYNSGAITANMPRELVDHFGFDKAATYEPRYFNTDEEWEDRIYGELAAGRPVVYSGTSAAGGHTFIIDGADAQGMFHVNWGWGGYQDGFFALTGAQVLNPDGGGTGGAEDKESYDRDHYAMLGAQPDQGNGYSTLLGSIGPSSFLACAVVNGFVTPLDSVIYAVNNQASQYFAITGHYSNYGETPATFTFGIQLKRADGKIAYKTCMSQAGTLNPNQYYTTFAFNASDFLSPGTYEVRPAYRLAEGDWQLFNSEPTLEPLKLTVEGVAPDLYLTTRPVVLTNNYNKLTIRAEVSANKDLDDIYVSPIVYQQVQTITGIGYTAIVGDNDNCDTDYDKFGQHISLAAGESRELTFEGDFTRIFQADATYLVQMEFSPWDQRYENGGRSALAPVSFAQFFIQLDATDDIREISNSEFKPNNDASPIYNLNGQRVSRAQKGLYIIGGKKVIVR